MKNKIFIDESQLRTLYEEYKNINTVSKLLNCNRTTVWRRLHYLGIDVKNRKYELNDNYFDKIDTEAKAYFLGLLYADGCNFTKVNRISIGLVEQDVEIIEKFKSEICSDAPIKSKILEKETHNNQKYFVIYSEIMSKKLIELGCINNKSTNLIYPYNKIPENLEHHFIRGVFDGDGSVGSYSYENKKSKKNEKYVYHSFNITGNLPFLIGIQDIFINKCTVNKTKINQPKRYKNGTGMLCYSGRINLLKLKEYLYKDATIYLERKKIKFDQATLSKHY